MKAKQEKEKKVKSKKSLGYVLYIIKSYLKLEPCGYCGEVNDAEAICYKCFPK